MGTCEGGGDGGRKGAGGLGPQGRGPSPDRQARRALLLSLSLCPATGAVCPGPSDFSLCAATCWGGSPRVLEWSF